MNLWRNNKPLISQYFPSPQYRTNDASFLNPFAFRSELDINTLPLTPRKKEIHPFIKTPFPSYKIQSQYQIPRISVAALQVLYLLDKQSLHGLEHVQMNHAQ